MYFVTKKCIDVDHKYDKMLYRCSFRTGGYMYKHFVERRECKKTKVTICFYKHKVIGWGLRFKSVDKHHIMLFVYKGYRKQGIGTKIYRRLSNGLTKTSISVYPNSESKIFFKKTIKL